MRITTLPVLCCEAWRAFGRMVTPITFPNRSRRFLEYRRKRQPPYYNRFSSDIRRRWIRNANYESSRTFAAKVRQNGSAEGKVHGKGHDGVIYPTRQGQHKG